LLHPSNSNLALVTIPKANTTQKYSLTLSLISTAGFISRALVQIVV
jgi:hypothetical protein